MLGALSKAALVFVVVLHVFLTLLPTTAFSQATQAQTTTSSADATSQLAKDIDDFFGAGAIGFLVWQYSGNTSSPFPESDKFSFYRDDPTGQAVCKVLKAKSSGGKFVGVNIRNAGLVAGQLGDHLAYLKNECGVTVIRAYAKETAGGPSGVRAVLDVAQGVGIKVIVPIADYVTGGAGMPAVAGKSWYESGYKTTYLGYLDQVLAATANHPALYGYELANEPHCAGDGTAVKAYADWANVSGNKLKKGSSNIGIGQMASQDTTRCDSPSPGDFAVTNGVDGITMTSAHYYYNNSDSEKQSAMRALAASKSIGKPFYIGEAPVGELNIPVADEDAAPVFVYPGIDSQQGAENKTKEAAKYLLTCGAKFAMTGELDGEKWTDVPDGSIGGDLFYENYISEPYCENGNDPLCYIPQVVGTAFINHEGTTIPLYRMQDATVPNPSSASRRLDDLEGFFGSVYVKNGGTTNQVINAENLRAPLANGVVRKLNTLEKHCSDKLAFLKSIQNACDLGSDVPEDMVNNPNGTAVEPQGRCALDLSITGTDLGSYSTYLKVHQGKPSDFSCNDPLKTTDQQWLRAFNTIEMTTPKGFQPAYIVRYIDLPKKGDPFAANDASGNAKPDSTLLYKVNWFSPGFLQPTEASTLFVPKTAQDYDLKNRIRITKVYVPVGFSQTAEQTPKEIRHESVFMQTMRSLFTLDQQAAIKKDQQEEISAVQSLTAQSKMNDPNPFVDDYISCPECKDPEADSLESIIARRINAESFKPGADVRLDNLNCDDDSLKGEQATSKKQTINPVGAPDPVLEIGERAMATLKAKGAVDPHDAVKERTIRTYLLLPEEYRNVVSYEKPFSEMFFPLGWTKSGLIFPPFYDKEADGTYKFLQMNDTTPKSGPGATVHMSSPGKSQDIGRVYQLKLDPTTGQLVESTIQRNQLKGRLTGPGMNFDINPLVPGGIMARTLWEIVCNVARPFNGIPTVEYKGIEPLLVAGASACTNGATIPGSTPRPVTGSGIDAACKGTGRTDLPQGVDAMKQTIASAVSGTGVPPEYIYGLLRIEGADTYTAIYNNQTNVACIKNSIGAVGPLQIMTKTCGAPFATFEENAKKAGIVNPDPCNFEHSVRVAATIVEIYAKQHIVNGVVDWSAALCDYHRNDRCEDNIPGCTSATNPTGNYGQCALEFAQGY